MARVALKGACGEGVRRRAARRQLSASVGPRRPQAPAAVKKAPAAKARRSRRPRRSDSHGRRSVRACPHFGTSWRDTAGMGAATSLRVAVTTGFDPWADERGSGPAERAGSLCACCWPSSWTMPRGPGGAAFATAAPAPAAGHPDRDRHRGDAGAASSARLADAGRRGGRSWRLGCGFAMLAA